MTNMMEYRHQEGRRRLQAAGKQSHRFPEADPGRKLRTTKTTETLKGREKEEQRQKHALTAR